ncbi:hypothetical protein SELSPUOL_01270 [Selenomonas sputigena ATCC 35185]|uniref:Uncharacterized protein n=1 Tax=Selenomonas sputigena (strain ATCC 35185 / DSM 20758 / CCUG 44933 / VPI D19B-28) TaxID=546271 RepID=C9LUX9_SELS3|nr:hypothetical protein SELSPUOL_01270 [Selenomonas sputigena ATCC 35185]
MDAIPPVIESVPDLRSTLFNLIYHSISCASLSIQHLAKAKCCETAF